MPNPSNLHRYFVGWDCPIITSAINWLRNRHQTGQHLDLETLTVVFPGRRAGRQFLGRLTEVCADENVQLTLPKIITTGGLPEGLYQSEYPLATQLEQTLAWCHVLRQTKPSELTPLLSTPPPLSQFSAWLELGAAIARQRRELASEGYEFSDLAEHFRDQPQEASRWQLLDRLSASYFEALKRADRADCFRERSEALRSGQCAHDGEILIVGAVDLNENLCQMLEVLSSPVHLLIAAPEDEKPLFDPFGCVIASKWLHRNIEVTDEQIVPAGDADDQARVTGSILAGWTSDYGCEGITVGITDEAMITQITDQLCMVEMDSHASLGMPLIRSAPGRLVSLILGYITSHSLPALAALVRHADLFHIICSELKDPEGNWLVALDQVRSENMPRLSTDGIPEAADHREIAERLIAWVDELVAPMCAEGLGIYEWCDALSKVVASIYQTRQAELPEQWGARNSIALGRMDEVLSELTGVSGTLDVSMPISAMTELVLSEIADARIHESREPDQIELVGWLDLAFDQSKALCVVGLNEPFVPESIVADPFLPGTLRHQLGIADNDQRFARDAYALTVMLQSRPAARLIVGRTSVDGSPTPPSRLLAACRPSVAAHRTRRLLGDLPPRPTIESVWNRGPEQTQLPLPLPTDYEPPEALSVTAFGDYLRCPYRFYLRHIARARPLEDNVVEMAANQFGNLIHDTLEAFGLRGPKHSTDLEQVEEFLLDTVTQIARQRFGQQPAAAIQLQINSAVYRLKRVARRQVERTREGWLLQFAEKSVDVEDNAYLVVDGERFGLKGRIDRVDYNEQLDMFAVIDYKTHGHDPYKKHLNRTTGKWMDLQLPLYRHMLWAIGVEAEEEYVQLGYFNIGEKESQIGVNIAQFALSDYQAADEEAAKVVRGVRNGVFLPNPEAATSYDDYAVLCQTAVVGNLMNESDELPMEEVEA